MKQAAKKIIFQKVIEKRTMQGRLFERKIASEDEDVHAEIRKEEENVKDGGAFSVFIKFFSTIITSNIFPQSPVNSSSLHLSVVL